VYDIVGMMCAHGTAHLMLMLPSMLPTDTVLRRQHELRGVVIEA
jgi:hypothetical protein